MESGSLGVWESRSLGVLESLLRRGYGGQAGSLGVLKFGSHLVDLPVGGVWKSGSREEVEEGSVGILPAPLAVASSRVANFSRSLV